MGVTSLSAEVSGEAPALPAPPVLLDAVEILSLIETALSWDLDRVELIEVTLKLADDFTAYGRVVVDDLSAFVAILPADSQVGRGAQATLSKGGRRLSLQPLVPSAAPRSTAQRSRNLARLVQALNRAVGLVGEEQVRLRPRGTPRRRGAPRLAPPLVRVDFRASARGPRSS